MWKDKNLKLQYSNNRIGSVMFKDVNDRMNDLGEALLISFS